jgi:carbamoyltransferase
MSFQSSACLMINGEIKIAISEERFSRIKNDERYPKNSINYILKTLKIKPNQIDKVAFISNHWSPNYLLLRRFSQFSYLDRIEEENLYWYNKIYKKDKKVSTLKLFKRKIDFNQFPGRKFWKKIFNKLINNNDDSKNSKIWDLGKEIRTNLLQKHLKINKEKIKFINHPFGHACFGYFSNPLFTNQKKILSVVIDAYGDGVNYSTYIFNREKNKILVKKIITSDKSLIARLYRYTTLILNFKPDEHEYKVMGLAPYAKFKYIKDLLNKLKKFQDVKGINFIYKKKIKDTYFTFKKIFSNYRFDVIAGALQNYTEFLLTKIFNNLQKKFKINYISYTGGVAMNVKANMKILENNKIKSLNVPFGPDDTSQSIGAAYACYFNEFNINNLIPKIKPIKNAYLGYQITSLETQELIKKVKKLKNFKIIDKNIIFNAAKILSQNYIIVRCCGASEFGPRALGNRSILCNPENNNLKTIINDKIKNRDFWMPFGVTTIDKECKKYFILKGPLSDYRFMTNCLQVTDFGKGKLAAGIHPADFTCRAQILSHEENPSYYDLIYRFGNLTKNYALLNTSLNFHGYPLANNLEDAFDIFSKSSLDAFLLEKNLIIKSEISF